MDFDKYHRIIKDTNPFSVYGKVSEIIGLLVKGYNPETSILKLP
jgi:hypothetical protein